MGKLTEIQSRNGDTRLIEEIDDTTLRISGVTSYIRELSDDSGLYAIDFEGGPYINKGMILHEFTITEIEVDPDKKEGIVSYIIKEFKDENDGRDPSYETQKLQLFIPAIKIKEFNILNNIFEEPKKTTINSLLSVLHNVNKNEKMSKLLTFTNLSVNLEPKEKVKNIKI